jgi:tRNA threonylcarbamoyladenosine biosynthesis protein TsaB
MRILALETSGRTGSIAALSSDGEHVQTLRETVLSEDQRTAQVFAPALKELLAQVRWKPNTVELVAVTVGPGSFTGLRIGVTAAKAFAYAARAHVVGVNTLAVLAAQAPSSAAPLWTIMDAQRRELFAAKFESTEADIDPSGCKVSIVEQDEWLAGLRTGDRVIGPVLPRLATRLPDGVAALDERLWQPMAATAGRVAWNSFQAGHRDDVWKLAPHYYRLSAAEEKRPSI